jgi:hypothetical protein
VQVRVGARGVHHRQYASTVNRLWETCPDYLDKGVLKMTWRDRASPQSFRLPEGNQKELSRKAALIELFDGGGC